VLIHGISEPAGNLGDRPLEARIAECLHLPAVTAHEMVVMILIGARRLVAGDPVAGVDALHQPQVGQGLERTVNGGNSHRAPGSAQPVEDFLRAHAAVLAAEEIDHCAPRAAAPVTGALQGFERMTAPAHAQSVSSGGLVSRIVLILVLAGALAGCGASSAVKGRKSVVAAFYPLAYAAQRVGGPEFEVENLTPPGSEPHDLELAPRTVALIATASIVLYLGHGFQPAVEAAVKDARGTIVDVLSGLPLHAGTGGAENLDADPHVWLDPILFAQIVERIGDVLHTPARADRLIADLHRLDRGYRTGLAHCARREIVTSHAAFGYLAQRYGLMQVPITGLTPESEPTARQLANVVKLVRRTHATTVFFETLVSPRLARTVAREVGAHTAVLDPIEGLTPAEQARGEDYLSLMRRNLATLRRALACR
jgi:zinc transport system substrate-binding protein